MTKTTEALLSEKLPYLYADHDRGILWLKDGSAVRSFCVIPQNSLSFTDDELEALRSGLSSVIGQIPEKTLTQIIFAREKSRMDRDSAIQNWIASHTDAGADNPPDCPLFHAKQAQLEEGVQSENLFQSKVYVSIRTPAAHKVSVGRTTGPLSHIAFWKPQKKTSFKSQSQVAEELEQSADQLKSAFLGIGFEVTELNTREQLDVIGRFLNPSRDSVRIETPKKADLSEQLSLTDLVETKDGLMLGRTSLRIGSLKILPEQSIPCLTTALSGIAEPFFFILTALMLPQQPERDRLLRKQRLTQGLAAGNNVRNLTAENQLQDIEDTLTSIISSGEKLLAVSFHVVSFESEKVDFDRLLEECSRMGTGCQWFEETVGAYPVFFGILPFAPTFITRPKRILSGHLSDFLPLYGVGPGHDRAEVLFETPYQSVLGYSPFEKSPSANSILIGSTGSGKSTLACGLILGMNAGNRKERPSAFVIDVGNSFKRTIQFLGGESLDLSPESGTTINPFDLPSGRDAPEPEKVKFLTALLEEILGDQGRLSKLELAMLETEILNFYAEETNRTFSTFKKYLEKSTALELKRLSRLLELWCRPHPYGLLFDGTTNVEINRPHLHFELKGCQRYPDLLRVAMLVVMDSIWREVKRRFPGRSLLVVDECHTVIRPSSDGRANSAARWVEDCFRQMRKFSSAAIAISQTAKDLKNDEIGDGILANAPNRFILRQRGDEKTLREDLKLNEKELQDVFMLGQVPGSYSEFFLQSESIRGVLRYCPTPLELWLSTTHPPDIELLEKERARYPDYDLHELMLFMARTYPVGSKASRP